MATSGNTRNDHREHALDLVDYARTLAPASPKAALTMAEAQVHATLALSAPADEDVVEEAPKAQELEAPAAEDTTDDTPPAESKPAPKRKRKPKAEPPVEPDVVPGSEEDVIRKEAAK